MSVKQTVTSSSSPKPPAVAKPPGNAPLYHNFALGYLRAFIILLILGHHSTFAYCTLAPAPLPSMLDEPRWWQYFPVVDSQHWPGFLFFIEFNDNFVISLLFFLSGLFVWRSLTNKGAEQYARERLLRLGLPFAASLLLVAPLVYYPTYLQSGRTGIAGFWQQWLSLGTWPIAHLWFVWVLLVFDYVAIALFRLMPDWGTRLGRLLSGVAQRPADFFACLVCVASVAYIPLALIFGPYTWTSFGPFYFQTSRVLHYLVYFLVGAGIGAHGIQQGLLAANGPLARQWRAWVIAALILFGLHTLIDSTDKMAHEVQDLWSTARFLSYAWNAVIGFSFVLSCAAISMAFLALFIHFIRTSGVMFESLRDNAYGIYLVHYILITWLQYALLESDLSVLMKAPIVFIGALTISWGLVASLRNIPAIKRVV